MNEDMKAFYEEQERFNRAAQRRNAQRAKKQKSEVQKLIDAEAHRLKLEEREQERIKRKERTLRLKVLRAGRPRSERRVRARLKMIPGDYRCPCCGQVKMQSEQWVLHKGRPPRCKGCNQEHGRAAPWANKAEEQAFFKEHGRAFDMLPKREEEVI